ncbi:neuroguidin [Lepeophtheirus salmonis]|uniref:Neuroguidin-B n=1 Tax=Lepeophtheirus salmonis TaxID=72036 RepID=C1BUG6_LEPSM|nr:neuroguidin-like [Lepeophtheirus salmonis]ACO12669.1 Neuroguidin-B [Lepeophtheirus salmonis]
MSIIAKTVSERIPEFPRDLISNTSQGLSILELRNHLLFDYNIHLALIALRKSYGESLQDSLSVSSLVELRVYLEKSRPIIDKIKYQIEKSLKVSSQGGLASSDPLGFKPNPSNLICKMDGESSDNEEDEDEEENETKEQGGNKVYKIPKNIPTFYDGDKNELERDTEDKARKMRMSKSLVEDLKIQHSETPLEESYASGDLKAKIISDRKERIRFEEDNFIRLPVTKKDRVKNKKRFSTINTIGNEITSFSSSMFDSETRKRKHKTASKGAGKKKKFKRRM